MTTKLESEKSNPKILPEWQPIETAPRDRTIVGGNAASGGVVLVIWFAADEGAPEGFFTQEECRGPVELTHWQPLPAAPVEV